MKTYRLLFTKVPEIPSNFRLTLAGINAEIVLRFDEDAPSELLEEQREFSIELDPKEEFRFAGTASAAKEIPDGKVDKLISTIDIESSGGYIPPEIVSAGDAEDLDVIHSSQCEDEQVESVIPGLFSSPIKPAEESNSSWDDLCYVPQTQEMDEASPHKPEADAESVGSEDDEPQVKSPPPPEDKSEEESSSPSKDEAVALKETLPKSEGVELPAARADLPLCVPEVTKKPEDSDSEIEVDPNIGKKKFRKKVVSIMSSDDEDDDETASKVPTRKVDADREDKDDGNESDIVIETQASTYRKSGEDGNDVNRDAHQETSVPETEEPPVTSVSAAAVAEPDPTPVEQVGAGETLENSGSEQGTKTSSRTRKKLYSSQDAIRNQPVGKLVDSQEIVRYAIGSKASPRSSRRRIRVPEKVVTPVSLKESKKKRPNRSSRSLARPSEDVEVLVPETVDVVAQEIANIDKTAVEETEPENMKTIVRDHPVEAVEVKEAVGDCGDVVPEPSLDVVPLPSETPIDGKSERPPFLTKGNVLDEFMNSRSSKSSRSRTVKSANLSEAVFKWMRANDVGPVEEYRDAIENLANELGHNNVPSALTSPSQSSDSKENQPNRKRKSPETGDRVNPKKNKASFDGNSEVAEVPETVNEEPPVPTRQSSRRPAKKKDSEPMTAVRNKRSTRASMKEPAKKPLDPVQISDNAVRVMVDPEEREVVELVPETATEDSPASVKTLINEDVCAVEETPVEPVSKRRGRPRKHQKSEPLSEQAEILSPRDPYKKEDVCAVEETPVEPVSKRRGRPKKNQKSEPLVEKAEVLSPNDPYNKETVGTLASPEETAPQRKTRRQTRDRTDVPVYSEEIGGDIGSEGAGPRAAEEVQGDVFKKPRTPRTSRNRANQAKKGDSLPPESESSFDEKLFSADSSPIRRAARIRLMFTGIDNTPNEKVKEIGVRLTNDITHCNILVAKKFTRTLKMMYAVARGIPIVSLRWVTESHKAKRILDFGDYLLQDKEAEKKFGFKLSESLDKSSESKLFDGWSFFVTKSCIPSPQQLAAILLGCNGTVISKKPTVQKEKTVIVSCPEDVRSVGVAAVPVVSTEFILNGLLKHEIDLNSYTLT